MCDASMPVESEISKMLVPFPAIIEDPMLLEAVQELIVLFLFGASFVLWRKFYKLAPLKGGLRSSSKKNPWAPAKDNSSVSHARSMDTLSNSKERNAMAISSSLSEDDPYGEGIKAAEIQMHNLLTGQEFTQAINMYRSLEKKGLDKHFKDEELFAAFIQASIRMGKTDVVERMMRTMKHNEIQPSLKFWQGIMKLLSSRKHFLVCLSIYALYGKQIPSDKTIYSCLINAALEVQQPEKAVAMLRVFERSGLDTQDYILFFRTYVAVNDLESATHLFQQLGASITSLMLNLLLLICVRLGKPDAAWEHLCMSHEIEKSHGVKIVDRISYNTVMKGFALAGNPQPLFECLYKMQDHGLEPDDITLSNILDTCNLDIDFGAASQVVDLIHSNRPPSSTDIVIFTLFIKGLVRLKRLPEALELCDAMKKRDNSHPDIVTYSMLIRACVDQHDLDTALKIVEDMKASGQKPDDIILTHLLEGCRHSSNPTLGKRLFENMMASGVKPSQYTLITMLKLYGRHGLHDQAYELVATWEKTHGFKASVIHYTCLMSACLRTKQHIQAWAAYQLMCEHGVSLDSTAVSTLLPGMVAAHEWDHALDLVKHALQGPDPIAIPGEIMNSALSQMSVSKDCSEQVRQQLWILMKSASIPITARKEYRKC